MSDEIEIADGDTTWRFEPDFLKSNWTCIFGRGCLGILSEPTPELAQGCCSLGAEVDADEAPTIAALAATLDPEHFQHHQVAADHGIFADDTRSATRVVNGACIFLNRPGFTGGSGCALHIEAVAQDESPMDWKPSVCWQLPVKVDWSEQPDGTETATVRGWTRNDWGADGAAMAWCCTQDDGRAYVGTEPVVDSLSEELTAMVGERVYVELRRRLDD